MAVCPNESFPGVCPPNPGNPLPVGPVVDGADGENAEVDKGGLVIGGDVNPVEGLVAAVVVNDNPPNAEFKSPRALCVDGTDGVLTAGVLTAGVTGAEGAGFGAYNRKILFLRSFRDVATGAAAAGTAAAAEVVVSAELKRVRTGDVKSNPNKD